MTDGKMIRLTRMTGWAETMVSCGALILGPGDQVTTAPVFIPSSVIGPCTVKAIQWRGPTAPASPLRWYTEVQWGMLGSSGTIYVLETPEEIEQKLVGAEYPPKQTTQPVVPENIHADIAELRRLLVCWSRSMRAP